ncbi:MAG: Do family serine endopeptidase [Gammaproteobacteria bacterium]|nr:Do family serine endopeptidase [Gammaproteobacteria bacterium]
MIRSLRCRPLGPALFLVLAIGGCTRAPNAPPDFSALVARVSASVVNISASAPDAGDDESDTPAAGASSGDETPEWLRKYLQQHPQEGAPAPGASAPPAGPDEQGPNQPKSLGSGFILRPDGEILTNEHVVEGASEVVVRLSDGREFTAKVLGSDQRSDLALLKIDAQGLPAAKLGDTRKLKVGQWVVAIGSPFGFDYSVTAGIVSAKGRALDSEPYVPFIQTDAAINPGNSGGPLFDMSGEVVGVNSQIYSQTGGFMGVAFAVPIEVAAKVAKELADQGRVQRGWIGVVVQEVDRGLAKSFGLSRPRGALIARVLPDSPAQQSGLRAGDIILSYDGVGLQSSRDLPPLSGNDDPGKMVSLGVLRAGRQVVIRVQLGELPETDAEAPPPKPQPPSPGALQRMPPPSIGLTVRDAAPGNGGSREPPSGVEVLSVAPGTARAAGIVPGDVLLVIAGQTVNSVADFKRVIARLTPGQTVPVLVRRRDGPLFLALQVPAAL